MIYSIVNLQKVISKMSHVDGFPDKDGLDKIVKLGKALCGIVASVTALLLVKYPDDERIQALLAAIAGVCALLPPIEANFLYPEGTNETPLDAPGDIEGINETLLPAEAPDFA